MSTRNTGMFGVELLGVEKVRANLERIARQNPEELERAIYHEAGIERSESVRRCPKKVGTLRATHEVETPVWRGREVSCTITVGGPAAPYAVVVHENTDPDINYTTPGTGPKYLESTIRESAPFMARRIARRIRIDRRSA